LNQIDYPVTKLPSMELTFSLDVDNLSCERDDRMLFENLSLHLHSGNIIQIEGPNGSGKTTLMRILAGLSSTYTGSIKWNGLAITSSSLDYFKNLFFMGHKPGVKTILTPVENLQASMGIRYPVALDEIYYALEQVGLYGFETTPCHSLSAGQQRRVALARLYLSKEPLWLLDEAFTAIDLSGVEKLEQLLVDRANAGGIVLLTTHHELRVATQIQKVRLGRK
jgi:heme exporter protein A